MEITDLLKSWGITIGLLSVAATAFTVLLVLSLREFSFWFLRLNQILKNQKEVLTRLRDLEAVIKDQNQIKAQALSAASALNDQAATPSSTQFPLTPTKEKNFSLDS